jgi:ferredoxin-nitrate reductase
MFEAVQELLDIYQDLIPKLVQDSEIEGGLRILSRIVQRMKDSLEGQISRFGEMKKVGRRRAIILREALFPNEQKQDTPYTALETLHAVYVYLSFVSGSLRALLPVTQAEWDAEFRDVVIFSQQSINRMQNWVTQQLKVRSPQTLLVPTLQPEEF